MPSNYTVIQYVPDPVSGERVNVGVIAFSEVRILSKFLDKWGRVSRFAEQEIGFLQDFADDIRNMTSDQLEPEQLVGEGRLKEQQLREMVDSWMNSIQFTEFKASLLPVDELLEEAAQRYLREPKIQERARGRRTAAKLAAASVQAALEEEIGEVARELTKRNALLRGRVEEHKLDVVVQNGQPFFGAHGLSFEVRESLQLDRLVDSTAWSIDDIRQRDDEIPLAVFALPPKGDSEAFARAGHIFEELGAPLIAEGGLQDWVVDQAPLITARL